MRDDQHGASPHQLGQRLLDHELALGVEIRRRLVEDQDRGIFQKRARMAMRWRWRPRAARGAHHERLIAVGQPA